MGRVFDSFAHRFFNCLLKHQGFENKCWRRRFSVMLAKDWKTCESPLRIKLWAVKHGFFPSRVELFGLNNENFKQFLSDFDYLKLHPLNNHFQIWINDKITLKYIFQDSRFKEMMPDYYIYIENDGHYSYLMDFDPEIEKDSNALLNVLKKEKELAMKPSNASGGGGFMKLEYLDNNIFVNNKLISAEQFEQIKTSKGYIVTQYCHQHEFFNRVWPKSECTLRIILAKINSQYEGGEYKPIISYARIGTEKSGETSNLTQGGIGVPFDFETGTFGEFCYRYKRFDDLGKTKYEAHPDTNVSLKGEKIPNWDQVKQFIYSFGSYLSSLDYFGFDVIVTDEGFKICEINSLPCLDIEQVIYRPLMTDEFAKRFFEIKLKKCRKH